MKQGGVIEQKSNMLRWIPPGSPGLGGVEVKNEKHMRQDHLDASHQVFDELPHTQFYQQLYRLSLSPGISTVRSVYEHEGCWQVEDAMRLARGRCQTEDLT
ncbi:hypothetical protein YC2023_065892 [Brassica napus]